METGYDFILGTPWSHRFRSTKADWATNTLVLKTKCGQTYRVPFIGTTATPRPDPPPPEPSVPTPFPSITITSPRQFAYFIGQDDVTFFMVNVTDLLHYDPPCPDAELIPLEPDPPSISMAPISISQPPSSVESTLSSRADADAEELTRYTAGVEPAVRDLIREYHDVFQSSFSYADIPPMRDVEHSIQLVPDYRVHHQAPYRLSIPEATELKHQLEELLRLGFIKPSNSPWGAPVLFARKADETLCLCIDYRGLNRYTVKNNYPMPRSDELFDRLAGNRFFTKIDLRSGYHQIHVVAADQPKTAFRSRFGHYEFTVMPFGLTNAPATFQRAMRDIFRDILEQYVLVYLDDILVYSRTLEEHLRHLRDVLDRLRRHGFYAMLSKCRFAQHKVDFLEHYVSDQGLHMDDAKITSIAEWPAHTSAKQLRSFLGLTSYYSNFIRGYTRYSYVLTSTLLWKNPPWAWTPLHEDAFRALKKAVTCAPVLHLPDASDFAVGAVLSQVFPSSPDSSHPLIPRFPPPTPTTASRLTPTRPATDEPSIDYSPTIAEDGTIETRSGDCPIAFYSRQLLPAEINYTADEREGTREPRICVLSTGQLRVRAVAEFHDQAAVGHMGFHKTLALVSRLYIWPKRKDFVKDLAECPTCQEVYSANHLPYGLLQPLPIPEGRWQFISMDFIGPLRPPTLRGHDAILVVVDRFTKRARFVLCRYAISAREVADIMFDRVVRDHDLPLSIISDRDPRFTSRFLRWLDEVYDTQLRFSSSYDPQTDGQTEIMNMTLGDILRKIARDDQQWDLHLAHAEIAYNHAVSPAMGMSPYYCDLGYHPRVPADFLRPSQMHPDTSSGGTQVPGATPDIRNILVGDIWFRAAIQVLPETTSLWDSAFVFASIAASIYDTFVVQLYIKGQVSVWGPLTAIRQGDAQHPPDPTWMPVQLTIDPEYPSGTVVLATAGLHALESYLGTSDVSFTVTSLGITRTFRSLYEYIDFAAEHSLEACSIGGVGRVSGGGGGGEGGVGGRVERGEGGRAGGGGGGGYNEQNGSSPLLSWRTTTALTSGSNHGSILSVNPVVGVEARVLIGPPSPSSIVVLNLDLVDSGGTADAVLSEPAAPPFDAPATPTYSCSSIIQNIVVHQTQTHFFYLLKEMCYDYANRTELLTRYSVRRADLASHSETVVVGRQLLTYWWLANNASGDANRSPDIDGIGAIGRQAMAFLYGSMAPSTNGKYLLLATGIKYGVPSHIVFLNAENGSRLAFKVDAYNPQSVAFDARTSRLYIADFKPNETLRILSAVLTIGENDLPTGRVISFGNAATFTPASYPTIKDVQFGAQSLDPGGLCLYVGDEKNHTVRAINLTAPDASSPIVVAGLGTKGDDDGDALKATFSSPFEPVVTADGCNLFVAQGGGTTGRLRWVTLDSPCSRARNVSTVAVYPSKGLRSLALNDDGTYLHLYVGTRDGHVFKLEIRRDALHKCAIAPPPRMDGGRKSRRHALIAIGFAIAVLIVAVCASCLLCSCRRRKWRKMGEATAASSSPTAARIIAIGAAPLCEDVHDHGGTSPRALLAFPQTTLSDSNGDDSERLNPTRVEEFPLSTLSFCTRNFDQSHRIGDAGAFGEVFWGRVALRDVAVKLMRGNLTAAKRKQFVAEANTLSRLHHANLIELIGYCQEGDRAMLVYPFFPGGSLHARLHNRPLVAGVSPFPPLTLFERMRVVLHTAEGIRYLHHGADPPVIHRDIKSSNILLSDGLGKDLRAVVADFGLAKIVKSILKTEPDTSASVSRIVGTPGYMSPEYIKQGRLTEKHDVYAFGVVVFEVITGRSALLGEASGRQTIVDWIRPLFSEEQVNLTTFTVDSSIRDDVIRSSHTRKVVMDALRLARDCTEDKDYLRPSMSTAVERVAAILSEFTMQGGPYSTD
ncbi:hypothetical protein CBR_g58072 [Chara braunii]|uniref:Reverse transcriptase n=1 Tax=Chara braunii TaxID=69332 RepID=A0A388MEK3_CHABU|nr:hypothetical protein CBR_g58072 [Chara braunii]|eukprot:GBG92987.1 hypothetical protein CBR_g58072 [Chara braunii]